MPRQQEIPPSKKQTFDTFPPEFPLLRKTDFELQEELRSRGGQTMDIPPMYAETLINTTIHFALNKGALSLPLDITLFCNEVAEWLKRNDIPLSYGREILQSNLSSMNGKITEQMREIWTHVTETVFGKGETSEHY